ncbi:cytochrome P450 18a1 [Lepeophtheirus salmonis]|uniref:cytochrome P450 18a1 n=1 Tax=Lepeophtheirus salmonis TaxID=72036 RepID=UPI001AE4D6AB|nr:cytochrome P450 2C15-like [Lepeophtheirus salmonis]
MPFLLLFSSLLLLFLFLYLFRFYHERWGLPPGPFSLPLVGSLPFLSSQGSPGILDFALGEKFGSIYTVDVIWSKIVVLNDFAMAKDLFNREDVSGRYQGQWHRFTKGYDGIAYGIINNEGPMWQSQRRFALTNLKNLGFGKKSLESVIYNEVHHLFEVIDEMIDGCSDVLIHDIFHVPIINVLWSIIASHRFEYSQAREIVEKLGLDLKKGIHINIFISIFANYVPLNESDEAMLYMKRFISKNIDEHKNNLEVNAPKDFIDFYLIEMLKSQDPYFSKKQLIVMLFDFFLAGSETTSTTLLWIILLMCLHNDIQLKCYQEISQNIGNNFPREEDMKMLPFTLATISEVQRYANIAPASLVHKVLQTIRVGKYLIPKGTSVIANYHKFHMDPKVFPHPHEFNPYRFYKVPKPEQFVPYGFGKRICMGKSLAKKQLFYFFVMIVQNYIIRVPKDNPRPDPKKCTMGITSVPDPFYVNIQKRVV